MVTLLLVTVQNISTFRNNGDETEYRPLIQDFTSCWKPKIEAHGDHRGLSQKTNPFITDKHLEYRHLHCWHIQDLVVHLKKTGLVKLYACHTQEWPKGALVTLALGLCFCSSLMGRRSGKRDGSLLSYCSSEDTWKSEGREMWEDAAKCHQSGHKPGPPAP